MDVNNASDFALADGPAPSGDHLAPPLRARWRQRAVGRCRTAPAGPLEASHASTAPLRTSDRGSTLTVASPGSPREVAAASGSSGLAVAVAVAVAENTAHVARTVDTGNTSNTDIPISASNTADTETDSDDTTDTTDTIGTIGTAGTTDTADTADTPDTAEAAAGTSARVATAPDADGAPPPPDADPQRAPRDNELWLLARRAQGAALRLDFELRTALARQVFRRDFVYVSRQLHALEASRRVQGLDRARLDDALATLRQRADTIQAFMEQRAADLRASVAARGPAGVRIAFARPARFQATIVSPGAHRFLSLLMQADETLAQLEMAWLLGLVEPATRSTLVSDCRRALLGFKDLACDRRHAVGMLVQELNAQRREGCAGPPDEDE